MCSENIMSDYLVVYQTKDGKIRNHRDYYSSAYKIYNQFQEEGLVIINIIKL